MIPADLDLKFYRGVAQGWQFKFWRDDNKSDPSSLAGVTAIVEIWDGSTPLALSCAVILPNSVEARLTAEDSAALPSETSWHLTLTEPGGQRLTAVAGHVTVDQATAGIGLTVDLKVPAGDAAPFIYQPDPNDPDLALITLIDLAGGQAAAGAGEPGPAGPEGPPGPPGPPGADGVGADEVAIGPADPGASTELWFDTDATAPAPAVWLPMTQAAYDALPLKDPNTLYVVAG